MSQLTIRDGTGCGYVARVDAENRLETVSVMEAESKVFAEKGHAYSFSAHDLAVPANTSVLAWWVSFEDPQRKFFLNTFFVGWNGGNTTGARTLTATLSTGIQEPTANHTPRSMSNVNFTSTNTASTKGYVWNGAGAGLVAAGVPGLTLSALKYAPGMTHVPIGGTMILGKGNNLATFLTSSEAGVYSAVMSGWFE